MNKRGPKPTPKKIKELKGTDRADRAAINPIVVTQIEGVPDPPTGLDSYSKKVWLKVCAELNANQMLFDLDLILLKEYCYNVGLLEKSRKTIKKQGETVFQTNKNGSTNEIKSPWMVIYEGAFKRVLDVSSRFGFSPSDRVKLPAPNKDEMSEFESFMSISK